MFDTHCHLDSSRFDVDRQDVLARAAAAGVNHLLVPGVTPDAWPALLDWARRDPRITVALGIHPQVLPELSLHDDDRRLARLDELLSTGVARAVGECGLDGPSSPGAPMDRQVALLRGHFALAAKHHLPVVVHCLRAHQHLESLLSGLGPPPAGIVLHSYSGPADRVPFYAEHGCHFSFAGPVTFPGARRPLEALRAVPLERLLAETDAPDQAPHPHRGTRCEPAFLTVIVEAMAQARGEPLEVLRRAVTDNARALLGPGGPPAAAGRSL